jgi:hypothetical protein
LAGFVPATDAPWGATPRDVIEWAASKGVRRVHLDATCAGLRPRELDRSARRDVAAMLRRLRLSLGGIDAWIPPDHFADARHVDRAVAAAVGACQLAGELASLGACDQRPAVSMHLSSATSPAVRSSLAAAADAAGVMVADHQWPPSEAMALGSPIGAGFDPAAVLMAGESDPCRALATLARGVVSVRLSDLSSLGRVPPGEGRLDVLAYEVAVTTSVPGACLVVDSRGMGRDALLRLPPMAARTAD